MKKLLSIFFILVSLIACLKNKDSGDPSELRIRLSNVSQFDFKNITVNTLSENVSFEDLNSAQYTAYKVFELAYSYAFVELEIEGETYTLQPIDYLGETPLENGNYTYQIDANDSQDQYGKLSLTLVVD